MKRSKSRTTKMRKTHLRNKKTEIDDPSAPVEFDEDDIAYQLAAMGEDYGLDPGEYDDGGNGDLEEGAEGLPLTD